MPVQIFSTAEAPFGAVPPKAARRLSDSFAPHAQSVPDMSVQLEPGHLLNGTALIEVLSQTVGPFALPSAKRVDRVVIDRATGAASIVTGTEGSMVPPAIPEGTLPVARVRLSGETLAIGNGQIDDERALADLGTAPSVPTASESEAGIAEIATQAEVDAGLDDLRIVTPLKAATRYATKALASESTAGLAEIATQAEVDSGTDDLRFLTPLKAANRYATKAPASEISAGIAEIATQAEVDAGIDDLRIVTPLKAATRYATKALATETAPGIAEIATQTEVDTGTDDQRFLTPLKAATRYATKAAATETTSGVAEIATQAEVDSGTDDSRFVTPLKLATRYATKALATESAAGIAEIATQAEVDSGTDDQRFLTPLKAASRYATKAAASDTATGLIELATAAETQAGTDAARAVTPAAGAATYLKQGVHTIGILALGLTPRSTNGPAAASAETATNGVILATLDFDQTTAEYAQVMFAMPKSWNEGTVTFRVRCSSASATGAVVWGLRAVAIGSGDTLDAAFGTAQTVSVTVASAGTVVASAESAALTIAGTPAEGDMVVFELFRDAANGADTLAADARLHGLEILYTVNAGNDA